MQIKWVKNISSSTFQIERFAFLFFFSVHRDVKMQNILLKDHFKTLVLTDYGTATNTNKICKTQEVGTPSTLKISLIFNLTVNFSVTMAPEVCLGGNYAEQCDIYSWAIVFWQLLSKQLLPYGSKGIGSSKEFGFFLSLEYFRFDRFSSRSRSTQTSTTKIKELSRISSRSSLSFVAFESKRTTDVVVH